ncbi:unnamed protein product [Linum trigynum]|uniref:Endonuclease/exonuclease/phosphatase domain-containing protein n=1 Tax=Linum trigynum TaxID=586398 RepID=A0AAV2DN85_9ROSI
MKRSAPPLKSLAVVATEITAMSSPIPHRGGRKPWAAGRGFSDRQYRGGRGSHVFAGDLPDPNYSGLGRGGWHGSSNQWPPPAYLQSQSQQFRQPSPRYYSNQHQFRPPPPFVQSQNYQQFRQAPPFDRNQGFRPHQQQQQLPPRPPKELLFRNWEYANVFPPPNAERFSVLSYNILADYLAVNHRSKLYFHIPQHMLAWQWRKRSIVFELGLWKADIMCFQEVDRFQELEDELKGSGYKGIYQMRTGSATDGCAIFWRESKFNMVHEESIVFNKFGLRDNVAQICVLESISQSSNSIASTLSASSAGSNKVVVCNIHVLYNPRRGEIKIGQVRKLLEKAHAVSKLWNDAPVVLCGDFNCTPKSPLYNFISQQKLDLSEVDRDKVSGQASAEIRAPTRTVYSGAKPNHSSSPGTHSPNTSVEVLQRREESDSRSSMTVGQSHESSNSIEDTRRNFKDLSLSHEVSCSGSRSFHSLQPISDSTSVSISVNQGEDSLESEFSQVFSKFQSEFSITGEDESSFLASLHETNDTFSEIANSDLDQSSGEFRTGPNDESKVHSPTNELANDFSENQNLVEVVDEVTIYDPSIWTPTEIATATGDADCTCLQHPLTLRSAYTQVENHSGTRDSSNGEPEATSYNRHFLGTVDYIWFSKGLQTVGVLAPIPKRAMQWTTGFPTKKWGSDHIALVSELAFTPTGNLEEVARPSHAQEASDNGGGQT